MAAQPTLYSFAEFELDLDRCELRRAGAPVHVEPKVLDLICHLVVNRHRVVSKNELLDAVWGDRFVSESALTSSLKSARRALGDSGAQQRFIRTVQRKGYRFVHDAVAAPADHVAVGTGPTGSAGAADGHEERNLVETQQIRFCHARDGARIAFATVGHGPVLMKAANWMTHLDLEWTSPVWSHWLHGLAQGRRLVRYDERGCGLSTWDVPGFGFDDWVDDLATVVDAAGLDRFPLLGVSQGGSVAITYAVQHPERVSHLILSGAYARGRLVRAQNAQERAAAELNLELARVGWGREDPSFLQVFASQFLPDGTHEEWAAFTDFQRRTTSPDNAVRFLEVFGQIDVTRVAGGVSCPTLILHSRADVRVPVSQATELADLIPDSRLVLLESHNHLLTEHEPAWPEFLAQITRFLAPA